MPVAHHRSAILKRFAIILGLYALIAGTYSVVAMVILSFLTPAPQTIYRLNLLTNSGLMLLTIVACITLMVQARTTIRQLQRQLAHATAQAEERLRAQQQEAAAQICQLQARMYQREKMVTLGQMVTGVVHDLSNPLTTILGTTQLLLEETPDLPPTLQRDLALIETNAERARRIIANLLAFARQREIAHIPSDINDIVTRTLTLHAHQLQMHAVDVQLQLAPDLPPVVADPFQIQQALLNVLVNAEQALTDPHWRAQANNGAEVQITTVYRADAGASPGMVMVQIADNGPGIPATLHERIFEPFFTTKSDGQGTGLGLALAADIVKHHGGAMRVVGANGKTGATMEIALPAAQRLREDQIAQEVAGVTHGWHGGR